MNITSIVRSEIYVNKYAARIAAVGIAVFLITIGAYIRIPVPFTPVPLTMQTFFVVLMAAYMGGNLAMVSAGAYMALGLAGVPVFQGYGSGLSYLSGVTGGYLFGFVFAAFLTGYLTDLIGRRDSRILNMIPIVMGELVIFAFGVTWLKVVLNIGIYQALALGLLPFIPGEIFKMLIASYLYSRTVSRARAFIV